MAGARLWIAAAIAAGGLVLAWSSLSRVPEGYVGVVAGEPMSPGWHVHAPFARVVSLPVEVRRIEGTASVTTVEGASAELPYAVTVDLARAGADGLRDLALSVSRGQTVEEAVRQAVEDALARRPTVEAGAELARLGLVEGSLRLGEARAGRRAPHPLRDAYQGPRWPVLLIGIDSADWDLIGPMIEAGELPNLASLRARGTWGTLHSMKPTLSPILWTTLATGRPPEEHGIIDFLMTSPATGEEVPISRLFRRVKALWNIATDLDISSATVGWWATWPAEQVSGQMVTDRVAYSLFDLSLAEDVPGAVYPESLAADIERLEVAENAITFDDVREILDIPEEAFRRSKAALDSAEGFQDPVAHLIKVLASTQTYFRIAVDLIRRDRPELALVYFEGLDEVNHRFAHYMPPALAKAPDGLADAYAQAVPGFYRYQDRLLGRLLDEAGPEAVVIVVSDHGFANGDERPVDTPPDIEGKPGLWHTLDGVVLAAGPPIAAGQLPRPVELLDLAPTVLAILGLPPAQDMPGRALTEMFAPGEMPTPPDVIVASYDAMGDPLQSLDLSGEAPTDDEMIARLRALGYIDSGGAEGTAVGAGTATATYHVNSGHLFLQNRDFDRARREFEQARELAPRFDQPLLGLAQVAVAQGRPGDAVPFLEEALSVSTGFQPALLTRAARVWAGAGRLQQGIEFLGSLELSGRREAFRRAALGMLLEKQGDRAGALKAYEAALAGDPSVEAALAGVYSLLRGGGDQERLAEILSRSLDARPARVAVKAANWLALTRERQGRREEGRSLLADALVKVPDDVMTLTNLGSMLLADDRPVDALEYLQRAYELRPSSHEIVSNLIMAHGRNGDLDHAREVFAASEDRVSRSARHHLYNAMALACHLGGAQQEAAEFISRSLEIDPDQPVALKLKEEIDRVRAIMSRP